MQTESMNSDPSPVSVRVDMQLEEYRRANFDLLYKRKGTKLLLLTSVVVLLAVLWNISKNGMNQASLLPLAFPLICLVLLPISVYLQSTSIYKRDSYVKQPITYTFTEEGVSLQSEAFQTSYLWKDMYRLMDSKEMLLLFVTKRNALLLPKRCFPGEQAIAEVKRLYKQRNSNNSN